MATISIDDKEYDVEALSDHAKQQIQMLSFADQEIARLNALLAIAQTARIAYSRELASALPQTPSFESDTIKFN